MAKKEETAPVEIASQATVISKRNRVLLSKEIAFLLQKEKQFERNAKAKKRSLSL